MDLGSMPGVRAGGEIRMNVPMAPISMPDASASPLRIVERIICRGIALHEVLAPFAMRPKG